MNKSTVMVLVAAFTGLFCAYPASAQNISIVSGNGQLICQTCFAFTPMYVQVTDSNGIGQPNVTVNWAVPSGGYGGTLINGATTITVSDGTASNTFVYNGVGPQGSAFVQYAPTTVVASTPTNATATFSLYQALYDPSNPQLMAVSVMGGPYVQTLLAGDVLTGQAGSTGSTPLQVTVMGSRGGGIANVSVQLVNYLNQSPVVKCAGAAGGEANTVLTDANGLATCSPVFGGVPGRGQFYILVGAGGLAPSDPTVPPFANWIIGNLNLTVTPAQPGLIKVIQGNGQSAAPGQTLASPLQVEVDTASGSPVAGQSVNWTVIPAGAVNLSSSTSFNGRDRPDVGHRDILQ